MTYKVRFIEEQTIKKNFLRISILSDEDRKQSRKKTVNRQTSGEEKEGTLTNHIKGRRDKIKNV